MADEIKIEEAKEEKIPSMDDFKEELEASFKQHANAKRVDMSKWEKILDDFQNKTSFEVEVNEAVKSGVTASVDGLRAFIPASKLSLGFVKDEELKDWAVAKSHSGEFPQFFGVRDRDRAAAKRDDAVVGEVAQHARDGLAHGAGVARDLLVRGAHGRAGMVGLVPEMLREALVKAREQQLLHRPHDVGKALGR